jgi:hypothetical protein
LCAPGERLELPPRGSDPRILPIRRTRIEWSGWGDSNSRRPAPKAGGLAAGPHPVGRRLVRSPGLQTLGLGATSLRIAEPGLLRGRDESNARQRVWKPLRYHYTTPPWGRREGLAPLSTAAGIHRRLPRSLSLAKHGRTVARTTNWNLEGCGAAPGSRTLNLVGLSHAPLPVGLERRECPDEGRSNPCSQVENLLCCRYTTPGHGCVAELREGRFLSGKSQSQQHVEQSTPRRIRTARAIRPRLYRALGSPALVGAEEARIERAPDFSG